MLTLSNRELLIFNEKGDKVVQLPVPPLVYLKTEDEWVQEALVRCELQGMVLMIDWETRQILCKRHSQ